MDKEDIEFFSIISCIVGVLGTFCLCINEYLLAIFLLVGGNTLVAYIIKEVINE